MREDTHLFWGHVLHRIVTHWTRFRIIVSTGWIQIDEILCSILSNTKVSNCNSSLGELEHQRFSSKQEYLQSWKRGAMRCSLISSQGSRPLRGCLWRLRGAEGRLRYSKAPIIIYLEQAQFRKGVNVNQGIDTINWSRQVLSATTVDILIDIHPLMTQTIKDIENQ